MTTEPTYRRMLAAVMFIDIAGYTALMQRDEQQAIALRDRKRRVLEQAVAQHFGEIRQYYGDGALVIFASAYNAVKAAITIQAKLHRKPEVPVRIGIHLGDVVLDDEGVYGDAVNVAARIEALAMPGSILLSEKVQAEIANHPEIVTRSLGSFQFKNVEPPVTLYAITNHESNRSDYTLASKWQKLTSKSTIEELIQPYITNINHGLTN